MHTKEAIQAGESEKRIFCLDAWEETSIYTNEERAALALTEAVTHISANGVSDELYQEVRTYFNEKEFIDKISSRSEEHTSELQSRGHLVCRLLLEKKKKQKRTNMYAKTKNRNCGDVVV